VPIDNAKDPGQLVALRELLDGRLEHPQLAVVVDDDLLAEPIVPEPQHHVDQHLPNHHLAHDDGARHTQVMVWVAAVHERWQGQVDGGAAFGGVAPHSLDDGADEQRVHRGDRVLTVEFRAPDGDEHYVVLAAVRLHLVADGGLDVGAGLGPLHRRGHAVLAEDGVDLLVARLPDLLLHTADRVVLEEQVGLLRGQQSLGHRLSGHVIPPNSGTSLSCAAQAARAGSISLKATGLRSSSERLAA